MNANSMQPHVSEGFWPSTDRGLAADQRMHIQLAASIEHLAEVTESIDPSMCQRLGKFANTIRSDQKLRPQTFRNYYLFVESLIAEDMDDALALLEAMETAQARASSRTVTHFGDPDADLVSLELIAADMRIAPITTVEAEDFTKILNEGFSLMQQAMPELYGEISAIVHEIILARAPKGDKMEFDGASHYQFWGLLMLNPKHHPTPLQVVEVLAHEASHSLLFGLTIEEPLVFNADNELYASPLRVDLRPMDGIYHATYVSARMCWAMENLAASGLLSQKDSAIAREAAQRDRQNYIKGLSVIDAHGRLSNTGKRVMQGARDWMTRT